MPLFYCEQLCAFFFTGQAQPGTEQHFLVEQEFLTVQAAPVLGHVLLDGHCFEFEAHPVKPKEATQATAIKDKIDFIRNSKIAIFYFLSKENLPYSYYHNISLCKSTFWERIIFLLGDTFCASMWIGIFFRDF